MSAMTDRVTFASVRSGGGNRYVSSYFAVLKKLGFSVVSSLAHNVPNVNYAAFFVFEHSDGAGVSREEFDAAIAALIERHVESGHKKPYVQGNRQCTEEIWYHNQRVEYTNEIRVWANDN